MGLNGRAYDRRALSTRRPRSAAVQALAPAAEVVPLPQAVHVTALEADAYFPAEHAVHAVEATTDVYFPATQAKHDVAA